MKMTIANKNTNIKLFYSDETYKNAVDINLHKKTEDTDSVENLPFSMVVDELDYGIENFTTRAITESEKGLTALFGREVKVKAEERLLNKLDTLDKWSIGISLTTTLVGLVGLLSYVPVFLDWLVALMLIGGGLSLLFTSLLLVIRHMGTR